MKRYLITGGAGFIGSHLAESLLKDGQPVTAVDNLETGTLGNLEFTKDYRGFEFVQGDIRDAALMRDLASKNDVVVHLAARLGLQFVVKSALGTIDTNVKGTDIVLDAAARYGLRTIVASTSEVYGLTQKIPSAEEDPIVFGSPTKSRWSYACGKAMDECLALALYRERELPATVVRLFNTVGARQTGRYGMVVPRFVQQAAAGKPLTVHGDGTQTRCFCSVHDVVDALKTIIANERTAGDVYNLGNPQETSILDLAQRVLRLTGSSSGISFVPYDLAYGEGFEEIARRVPDIGKLRAEIGFEPKITLDEILLEVFQSVREPAPAI